MSAARAAHPAVRVPADAAPYVEAYRCAACGAASLDQPLCCRRCAARAAPASFRLAGRGRLSTWSVVHRSYPGVAVPFVSAVIELDDGPALKGTLAGVEPHALRAGLRVVLRLDDAGGARDADGTAFVGFHFVPAEDQAG